MKQRILLILLLIVARQTLAQITIIQNDLPAAGDTLRFSVSLQFQEFDFAPASEQFQWDFSQLQHSSQGVEDYRTVTSVNWFLGTFVFPSSMALQALPDLPLEEFGLAPEDFWSVFKKSASLYTQEGFFLIYQGLPLPLKYTQADRIYSFPVEYGQQTSHPFSGSISLGDTLSLWREGVRTNHADGWGTLTTPYGTFETLRIKVTLWEKDSLFWQALEQPVSLQRTTTRYVWLAKNEKLPVLEASYVQFTDQQEPILISIRYRDVYREQVELQTPVANFIAEPTEAKIDELINLQNLSTPDHENNQYAWLFTPAVPNFHQGTHQNSIHPVVSFAAVGNYTVQLTATNSSGEDILTLSQYIQVTDPVSSQDVVSPNRSVTWQLQQDNLVLKNAPFSGILRVFDMHGRTMIQHRWQENSSPSANLSGLLSGAYILHIHDSNSGVSVFQGTFIKP